MKNRLKYIFKVSSILCVCALLTACNNSSANKGGNVTETNAPKIQLSSGAVLSNDKGVYVNYNLDNDEYKKIDTQDEIWSYNKSTGNYVGREENKFFAYFNGKKVTLDNAKESDEKFLISPNGKYLLLDRNDDGYNVIIINLEDGTEVKFNSKVLISGTLIDWVKEDTLVYYGINPDENDNGIFTYDLNNNSEKLVYEFDYGDALFIKGNEKGAIFLQEQIDEGRFLKKIDLDTGKITILSGNVFMVYDLVERDNDIYILGKIKDNTTSLYKIADSKNHRLVYDFPKSISTQKGLQMDEEGNVLFIGINNSNGSEDVFKCTTKGDLSIIKNPASEYAFVKIKN